ncbi:exonuclease [Peribacillus asahii]|uniref:Exonuclease n=1 Tax=Peribacillus asahii TaxID=228899 RepID=A0A3Q9RP60_9BACI|nr:3'-5' exonuclease [Peribacillus asahii]AZV43652.1 exonuclease [Peribacillus asahii]
MHVIIFDLEMNNVYKKERTNSIVEIGAVKVKLENLEIQQYFQTYIMPHVGIGKGTMKFIQMDENDVRKAVSPKQALSEFVEWIGKDYYLCSWGDIDKLYLIQECVNESFPLSWLKNYNDIQPAIANAIVGKKIIKLKDAIRESGIKEEGYSHSAMYDAVNTSSLFIKYHDQIELKTSTASENYSYSKDLYRKCNKCGIVKYFTKLHRIKKKPTNFCRDCHLENQILKRKEKFGE